MSPENIEQLCWLVNDRHMADHVHSNVDNYSVVNFLNVLSS